jgi:hypothetical protein
MLVVAVGVERAQVHQLVAPAQLARQDVIDLDRDTARFEKLKYRYLRVDDWLYWTSRSLWTPGQNLTRRPFSDVEGDPRARADRPSRQTIRGGERRLGHAFPLSAPARGRKR